jgi:hypothetical protein
MADPVPSGSDVPAGTYTSTKCGYELKTGPTHGHGGDSASDPAS